MPAALPDFRVRLQTKQRLLLRQLRARGEDSPSHLGYGGARGGAKSGGAQRCALILALEEPGIGVMIFRRTWAQLKKNHVDEFFRAWPQLRDCWVAQDKALILPNNSIISFVHAQTLDEIIEKERGLQAKYIFIDQAEQLSEEELKRLKISNRWPGTPAGDCKMVYLFNPGGPGTQYLRRIFFLHQYEENERAANYVFTHSFGWDNFEWARGAGICSEAEWYAKSDDERKSLFIERTDYGRELASLPESIRMGELMGRFDEFAGQYFAGVWDQRKCTLSRSQVERLLQPWWPRWMSLDWGFEHHAACFWFATGRVGSRELREILGIDSEFPLDIVVCYRELVVNRKSEFDLATLMVRMTPESERSRLGRFVVGPDVFAERRGVEHTIAEQMEAVTLPAGLPRMERADAGPGSRVASARMVYDGFRRSSSVRSDSPPADPETTPLLLIGADCPQLQSSIPILIRDPKHVEDVLKMETMQDDVFDGFKYGYAAWQEALQEAPREVRRQELVTQYCEEPTAESMTALSLAMRRFDAEERQRDKRVRRRG